MSHLLGCGRVALIVAQRQGIEMSDLHISLVALPTSGLRQPVVPGLGAIELALVQQNPGHMIKSVQPLAVAPFHGLTAKGFQRREIRRTRTTFHRLRQGQRRAGRRGGLALGQRDGDKQPCQNEGDNKRNRESGHAGSGWSRPCHTVR